MTSLPAYDNSALALSPGEIHSVVLDARGGLLDIYLRRGARRLFSGEGVPHPLRRFLATFPSDGPGKALSKLLADYPGGWPVVFCHDDGEFDLRPDPGSRPRGVLQLEGTAESIVFRKALDDGRLLGTDLIHRQDLLIDRCGRTVGFLGDSAAWKLWEEYSRRRPDPREREEGSFALPHHLFRGLREGDVVPDLRVDGRRSEAEAGAAFYELRVESDPDDPDYCLLCALGRIGDRSFELSQRGFALFAAPLYESLSAPMRAKKRRAALQRTFLGALRQGSGSPRAKAVRLGLATVDFNRREVKRQAKELIFRSVDLCLGEQDLLHFAHGAWRRVRRDNEREALLLQIPLDLFGGKIFQGSVDAGDMRLPRRELIEKLGELFPMLGAAGISLHWDGRPVVSASLDILLETSGEAIDWFELHPDIRCQGVLLDRAGVEAAASGGLVEIGGEYRLIDGGSRAALELLTGMENGGIIRIPRLHILDCLRLRALGVEVKLGEEDERIIASLTSLERIPERRPPALAFPLRNYQRRGYEWLAFLYEHKFGACLADDMGLGKTVQAISLLAGLREGLIGGRSGGSTPHLVVVPPTLLFNWEAEVASFYPEFRTLVYSGQERNLDFSGFDLVLSSYDLVRRDIGKLCKIPFHVAVFDEAQCVKNIYSATSAAVRRLKAEFKLALTGTPVENHVGEYYSIIDLVLPGLLGDYRGFARQKLEKVLERTRPFVLRRTKQAIAGELPDKIETDIYLDLTEEQRTLYRQTVESVRVSVGDAYRSRASGQARIIALAALTRLRRICLDPRLSGGEASGDSPKVLFLADQLEKLRDEGHSVLVFSQFTTYLDLVEEALRRRGHYLFRLDGSTAVGRRGKLVSRFQEREEPSVFLLSLKAGGRGLNLTRASYVFHLDPWWNPAVENQASDRAHRIGQTRKVTVQRLLMRHSLEEKMMVLKSKKLLLYRTLLEGGDGDGGAPLAREDFEFLLESL